MSRYLSVISLIFLILGFFAAGVRSQPTRPSERLGFRSGYIETTGKLDDFFGDGSFLTLHFTEHIYRPLYLDFRIGAIYLGDLLKPEVAEAITRIDNIESEMRILSFTVGPQVTYQTSDEITWYGSSGLGIYSVSILHDTGIQAFDYSDQHLGLNGGLGVLWRFAATWNVELSFTTHKFWTSREDSDLYYRFTSRGASSPLLYQLGLGISMDLR